MPRPSKCRQIEFLPDVLYFKPAGVSMREVEEVRLTLDETEAIRLADLEGLYQEEAAARMQVSRQTFANILLSSHRKIAEAIIHGKALRIEGGHIEIRDRTFMCRDCNHTWNLPFGTGCPTQCPECQSALITCSQAGNVSGNGPTCKQRKFCCKINL